MFAILTNPDQGSLSRNQASLLFEVDPSNKSEALDMPTDAKALSTRFKHSEGSLVVDLATPIIADVMEQNKCLINGIGFPMILKQTSETFRLLYEDGCENAEAGLG